MQPAVCFVAAARAAKTCAPQGTGLAQAGAGGVCLRRVQAACAANHRVCRAAATRRLHLPPSARCANRVRRYVSRFANCACRPPAARGGHTEKHTAGCGVLHG
ncbi:MAG: hypothetical protein Q4E77_08215 [Conchiformibius sp.]|nr:hypothetical protein [Conchiformibius sp.]